MVLNSDDGIYRTTLKTNSKIYMPSFCCLLLLTVAYSQENRKENATPCKGKVGTDESYFLPHRA